jgi:hypothetical protein
MIGLKANVESNAIIIVVPVLFNPAKDWKSLIASLKDLADLTAE